MTLESTFLLLSNYFSNPAGLYSLAVLVPIILIYLIRPRPKKRVIPALMFFLKDTGKANIRSFLRRLLKDPLLLLQLIILTLAAFAIAEPFFEVERNISGEDVVIVIDGSASSQTFLEDGITTRFEKSIDYAKELIGKRTTIILAGTSPEIVGELLEPNDATKILENLKPKDTTTNLYDAIIASSNYVNKNGAVFVFSDFIQTEQGLDIETAKSLVETSGAKVMFKKVFSKAKNVGIVGLDVGEESSVVLIRNFNDEPAEATLTAGDFQEIITLEPKTTEMISLTTPKETVKVVLSVDRALDDFLADNEAYITFPSGKEIDVLLLENKESKYLKTALSVMDHVKLTTANPPKVPDINKFEVIITQNIDGSLLLPGTISSIKKRVNEGGGLIVTAHEGVFKTDFQGMLPVEYRAQLEKAEIKVIQENSFTKDINFGSVSSHYDVSLKENSVSLAETMQGTSMLALKKEGAGNVVYYGIIDDQSSFRIDMYYPIFWKRLLDFITKQKDINSLNLKTGTIKYTDSSSMIKLPDGKRVKTARLSMDIAGIYRQGDDEFVASLIDEKESDVNGAEIESKTELVQETKFSETQNKDLTRWAILAFSTLLLFELAFIKVRGDI